MTSSEKPFYASKKALLAALGVVAILVMALAGRGDPAAYGAIGLIVSVACGGQAVIDAKAVER